MIAAFLLAAIAIDLALIELAARPSGFSRALGPVHLRLHDPSALLIILAILTGALVARGWHTRARGWALAVAPVTTAIAATAVTGHAERMFPLGDIAVIELYVRTALEGRLLVGPYSRFGWHHPGPAYFYLLAPFYAVSDHATASLAAGAAVIAMACIALLAWLAARTSGPRTAALLLLVTIALLARTPGLVVSAWNPHVVVLPAMVLIVAAAGAAGGDVALLPLAALVASFVAQTDVALVPLVFVVGIIAVLGALTATWGTNRYALLKAANTAAWVVLACWLVPAAEELTHSPGNLTRLWHFFVDARGTGQPLQAAAAAWATMVAGVLRPTFDLAGGGLFEANGGSTAPLVAVVELCALAAVAWWAWSRDRATARLALVSLAASVTALWSATRIEGGIMDHEVFWMSGLGAVNLACIAEPVAGALQSLVARWVPPRRWGAIVSGLVVAAAMVVCAGQLERAREGRLPATTNNPVVERLTGSVRQYLEGQDAHKPLVRIGENDWGFTAGVLLDLDRERIPFAIEPEWMPMFPQSFAANGEEDAEIAFGNGDEHAQRMRIAGAVPIASFAPLYIDGLPASRR